MNETTLQVLLGTAATVGFVHTLIGVDHSLPFVVLGRARGWSIGKTLGITALCGLAHVGSSVVLGLIGISAGLALEQLAWIQEIRGGLAAWGLIAFGLVFAAWSLVSQNRGKSHAHVHADGGMHVHPNRNGGATLHPHRPAEAGQTLTLWALFVVFVLGPCEALIPLLMAPAWMHHWSWVIGVVLVFGGITVATMLGTVTAGYYGLELAVARSLDRHANVLAGLAIAASGLLIQLLGV